MPDFSIRTGNRLPALTITCTYSDGTIQDLTGATVTFAMRYDNGLIKVPDTAALVVGPAVNGVLQYQWAAGDVDTAGDFQGEFHVVIGGKPVTFPNGENPDGTPKYLDIAITDLVA